MYKFGQKSQEALSTCHPDLQLILNESIKICRIDFGISEGHRSIALQQKYFKEKKSQIDGINKKGKHNFTPSEAADFYPYVNGKADWTNETLSFIAGTITAVADILFSKGLVKHKIRWGGNWDGDGEMLTDQSFDDRPHLEIVKP